MTPTMLAIVLILSAFPSAAPATAIEHDDPVAALSAQDLLSRMADAYAHCSTYADTGVARIEFIHADRRRVDEKPFKTAFVRPNAFRFEFEDSERPSRYIVARDGEELREWWSLRPDDPPMPSLDRALGRAIGVSGSSSAAVPTLLMPELVGMRRLSQITRAKRLEDAPCGSGMCARVHGFMGDDERILWIDTRDFLIRRVDTAKDFGGFRTEETTTYEPVVDGVVTPEELAFNAPPAE